MSKHCGFVVGSVTAVLAFQRGAINDVDDIQRFIILVHAAISTMFSSRLDDSLRERCNVSTPVGKSASAEL